MNNGNEELPSQRSAFFFERAKDLSLAGGSSSIEQERILRDLFKAVSFLPDHIPHFMFLGKLFRQALDITSSIFCYRLVLNLQATNLQARKQLSELLVVRGQELMVTAASVKSKLKFYAARACFDEALEVSKEDVNAWIYKSVCHVHADELTEAFEAITRAIKCPKPASAEMYILRAKIYWGRGLIEQGNGDIRIAAMLDSNHPEVVAFFNRSFLKAELLYKEAVKLFTQGMYKEALLSVNHAMFITTEDVKLLIMQSKIYRMLGELQPAYDSMLRAKAIFVKAFEDTDYPMELPSDIVLQINLILNDMALECASKGDYEKAILLLNKIIKTDKSLTHGGLVKMNHKYYVNRGDCHRALNSLADAVFDYNLALQIKPDDWEIRTRLSLTHYLIGTVYFNQSQYLETQAELDKAINFNPKVSEYYALRGRTHYFQSNFSQAYADFKRALELNSANNEVREWLSQFDDEERSPSRGRHAQSLGGGGNGAQSPRKMRVKKRIDFSKVSQMVEVSTVRKLEATPEDFVEMMLLPKKAAKLPVLRMLTQSDESKASKKSAASNFAASATTSNPNPNCQSEKINSSTLPTLRPDSLFAHDESRLRGVYAAAHTVEKKNKQLKELFNSRTEGVARGPLWGMVETAKALAYAKSHPKHRSDGEDVVVRAKKSSSATAAPAGGGGAANGRGKSGIRVDKVA